jgi:hypothetical protein
MSLEQIEYVDKLLPYYGCDGITDYNTLINKNTIKDWNELKKKIMNDMEKIKKIYPIKTLNLYRLNEEITQNQAVALLRGLLKIAKIDYVIVRNSKNESVRLDNDKKLLMYYIIHKKMATTKIKEVYLKKDFKKDDLHLTKRFLVKFPNNNELPKKVKYILFVGNEEIMKSRKLEYDKSIGLWEIKFYSKMEALNKKIPDEFRSLFYFNLLEYHNVKIYSENECNLFIEYYENNILQQYMMNDPSMSVYIEHGNDEYYCTTNILNYSNGMCCMMYGQHNLLKKYMNNQTYDVVKEYHNKKSQ